MSLPDALSLPGGRIYDLGAIGMKGTPMHRRKLSKSGLGRKKSIRHWEDAHQRERERLATAHRRRKKETEFAAVEHLGNTHEIELVQAESRTGMKEAFPELDGESKMSQRREIKTGAKKKKKTTKKKKKKRCSSGKKIGKFPS